RRPPVRGKDRLDRGQRPQRGRGVPARRPGQDEVRRARHARSGAVPVRERQDRHVAAGRRPAAGAEEEEAELARGVMPNIEEPEFDELRDDRDGFRARRARIGYQLATERLGLSLWEVPPGEAAYPYHFHLTEEELVIVVDGEPSLRTPDGWRE